MVQDVTNSLEDWDDFWYNSEDDLPDWTNNLEMPIMEQTNNEPDLSSYIKEIETQANKPLNVQLNEMKIAGAKLLLSLDKIIDQIDVILEGDKKD